MPYDLFISYSRRDNEHGRITTLVDRIQRDFAAFAHRDLVPFFDRDEIRGMDDWRLRIFQGLRESRLLLACLSPGYLDSEYCEWEFVEYLKHEIGHLHGFNGVAPIYFVEVPGFLSDFDAPGLGTALSASTKSPTVRTPSGNFMVGSKVRRGLSKAPFGIAGLGIRPLISSFFPARWLLMKAAS